MTGIFFSVISTISIAMFLIGAPSLHVFAAETLNQIIAEAKKEKQLSLVAGASTFGGSTAFVELETAFNKKFGTSARLRLTPGPSFGPMTARVLSEYKSGRPATTDAYFANLPYVGALVKENALLEIAWSKIFPWVTKEMETVPNLSLLVYTSLDGIFYNSSLISKEEAPRRYEDLVDSRLNSKWAGKMAIPPYTGWLVQLASQVWGNVEKTKDFARKMVSASGGRIRYNEEERIVAAEFPLMANLGSAFPAMWRWQGKGARVVAVAGSNPVLTDYYILSVPKNSPHPNTAKLFAAFMVGKEAQAILEKHEFRASHLAEGTQTAKYVRDNRIQLLDAKKSLDFFLAGGGLDIQEDFGKILKQ
jgi:ABC-type Fe3+ transport system substrate-binding protein